MAGGRGVGPWVADLDALEIQAQSLRRRAHGVGGAQQDGTHQPLVPQQDRRALRALLEAFGRTMAASLPDPMRTPS